MTINPNTAEYYKKIQAVEIEAIRARIRKLPADVQAHIAKGIDVIEEHIIFNPTGSRKNLDASVNVFDLTEDLPGDVMKHLAMLYAAAGFYKVSITCEGFISEHSFYVKFPNAISFKQLP